MKNSKKQKQAYNLDFQPAQTKRSENLTRFLLGFGAIFLLLGIASAYLLHKDGLLDQIIGTYFSTAEPETEPEEDVWDYSGSATILLCQTDAARQELRFVAVVRADAGKRQLTIFPLSSKMKAPWGDSEITLEQALREGGFRQLKAAVTALTEAPVDRYVSADDSGFTKAVNAMGIVTVQVEKRIVYRSEAFGVTMAEGTQPLGGDPLLRYFRYLNTLKEDGPAIQGELLKKVLETYLVPGNAETPEQMEKAFGSLVNLLETDISVTDFYTRREMIQALLTCGELRVECGE